jgi:hypothetical protein
MDQPARCPRRAWPLLAVPAVPLRAALAVLLLTFGSGARASAQPVPAAHGETGAARSLAGLLLADTARPRLAWLELELRYAWNSSIPVAAAGDGGLWAGRGSSARLRGGFWLRRGPLLVVVAPEFRAVQNRGFEEVLPDTFPELFDAFALPWQTGRHRIDLPYRHGGDPLYELHPGNSTLALTTGGVAAGLSTEQHWWGPGMRNALVLSDNAPGFPHFFVRAAGPVPTRAGAFEAVWLLGALSASSSYRAQHGAATGRRALSAATVAFTPAAAPAFTFGVARAVYTPVDRWSELPARFADVASRRGFTGDTLAAPAEEQITSLFVRWLAAGEGAEVYAEWARSELPSSFRDLLLAPEHGQGYTLGLAVTREGFGHGALRLAGEVSYLEQSSTYVTRPVNSFYASRTVPEGYTHQGRVLGAAIGPSGSSQRLALDWFGREREAGLFAGRIRWNNDAYNDWPGNFPARYQGHDVSVHGGARGAVQLAGLRVAAEWTSGMRYNFMFQNWAVGWRTSDWSVNVAHHSLRFDLSPAGRPAAANLSAGRRQSHIRSTDARREP